VGWRAFREQSTPQATDIGAHIGYPGHQNGSPSLGKFEMTGPFLASYRKSSVKGDQLIPYVPLPFDTRRTKDAPHHYFTLLPTRNHPFKANWPTQGLSPLWPEHELDFEEPEPSWLTPAGLGSYLQAEPNAAEILSSDNLFGGESRLGIALDYTYRRPFEGMLYQVEYVRPAPQVGLLVGVGDDVHLPAERGTLRLGGEGRAAYYQIVDESKIVRGFSAPEKKDTVRRFKIVLLSPAYFTGGWQPADGDTGWARILGVPVQIQLVAAALGRPHPIGGWDVTGRNGRGWHKPMYAYVPAGSVYFFETEHEIPLPVGPVTQTPEGRLSQDWLARLGYGQIATGTWEWLE
jgi:CRISPR-associated protein Cmr3